MENYTKNKMSKLNILTKIAIQKTIHSDELRSSTPLDFALKNALISRINTNKTNLTPNESKLKKVLVLSKKDKTYDNLLLRMLTNSRPYRIGGMIAGSEAGLGGMILGNVAAGAIVEHTKDRYARKHLNLLK